MKTCSRLHDNDWQGVTTNENEWERMKTSDNEWKQVTTTDKDGYIKWQQMKANDRR